MYIEDLEDSECDQCYRRGKRNEENIAGIAAGDDGQIDLCPEHLSELIEMLIAFKKERDL